MALKKILGQKIKAKRPYQRPQGQYLCGLLRGRTFQKLNIGISRVICPNFGVQRPAKDHFSKICQNHSHATFWKSITKVTPFSNKVPILHRDSIRFHLSHQPPLSDICHFSCSKSDTFPPKSDIFTT